MAIEFNTKTGDSLLNQKARAKKDHFSSKLRGMSCKTCSQNSTISFFQHQAYPGSSSVDWRVDACCQEFKDEIHKALGVSR